MADVHDSKTRSYNMSRIRSTNTKPELLLRKFLHAQGFRYRLHGRIGGSAVRGVNPHPQPLSTPWRGGKNPKLRDSSMGRKEGKKFLPGRPDIVLPKYRTVIFVHGCFWHGHARCKYFKIPKTRTDWWTNKINTNKANDAKAVKKLKKEGWKVVGVWECELKPGKVERTLTTLLAKLQ